MTTIDPEERPGRLAWVVDDHEKRITNLDKRTEDFPVMKEQMTQLKEGMDAIKRALWAVAIGLVGLLISVLFAAAQFGGGG